MIFAHQDIAFDDNKFEKRIIRELSENQNQIIGFAGMPKRGGVVSNLRYQKTKKYIVRRQIEGKTECCTLDECCFAMTASLYRKILFDENVCFHWHLYASEFCYNANRQFGTKSFVIPEVIYHKQDDKNGLYVDKYFLRTFWRLAMKYRRYTNEIRTPCYIASTNPLKLMMKILRTALHNAITNK